MKKGTAPLSHFACFVFFPSTLTEQEKGIVTGNWKDYSGSGYDNFAHFSSSPDDPDAVVGLTSNLHALRSNGKMQHTGSSHYNNGSHHHQHHNGGSHHHNNSSSSPSSQVNSKSHHHKQHRSVTGSFDLPSFLVSLLCVP